MKTNISLFYFQVLKGQKNTIKINKSLKCVGLKFNEEYKSS